MGEVSAKTVGDDVLRALDPRRVDDHVRRAQLLQELERLVAMLVVEPARVPELDHQLVTGELLLRPLEVLERARLRDDVRRQLEEDAAELARRAQRLERVAEAAEDLGAELARRPVDAAALVDGAASRRSGGSCSTLTGWRVITPNAFTCITKPSGVRSAQRDTIGSSGRR